MWVLKIIKVLEIKRLRYPNRLMGSDLRVLSLGISKAIMRKAIKMK